VLAPLAHKRRGLGLRMALALTLAGLAHGQPDPDLWQRQSIYQVITDRFFDGDPSNNNADGNYDPAGHRGTSVHGGDFKGLEQKLDYIKALGATAIWISPIVLNARGEFHGYAGSDFYKIDPHWGSLADLQHLVAAAHSRGILAIDDVVVNHGGDLIDSGDPGYGRFKYPPEGYHLRFRNAARQYAPPFDVNGTNRTLAMLFHNNGLIQNYQDARQVELGELSGLDDFNTQSDYVRARMTEIYEYWIGEAGFDGFRIDTVKHVEMDFWQSWCPAIRAFAAAHGRPNFFMFGEVYDGSEAKCGSYTGRQAGGAFALDSVLDYPLYFRSKSVFAQARGNTRQIEEHYAGSALHYAPEAQMRLVTFLDNHDQPRFLSLSQANNDLARLRVALVFLYTARGIPCLYYGTEQGFNGGNDPYDREDMFAGQFEQGPSRGDNFNFTHPLFQWVARLNNFRRLYPALQTGAQVNLWSDPNGPGLFAYARRLDTQEVFVVFNTATSPQALPAQPTGYPAGTRLVDLLEPDETIMVNARRQLPGLLVPGSSSKIFVARDQVRALDPVVTRVTPAHDAVVGKQAGVSALETGQKADPSVPEGIRCSIVIQFSQTMDTRSVESGFSTEPAVRGSFVWTTAQDAFTFTPQGAGFPVPSMVTLRISGARVADAGNPMCAPFESRFKTAKE